MSSWDSQGWCEGCGSASVAVDTVNEVGVYTAGVLVLRVAPLSSRRSADVEASCVVPFEP